MGYDISRNNMEVVMKHQSFIADARLLICALGALAVLASAGAGLAQTPATPTDKAGAKEAAAPAKTDSAMQGMSGMGGSGEMRESMMGMMKNMDSMKMSGDTDRDFAMMMKVHHQGAIDMAQMELKKGKDAKMRTMAKRIIEAQQKEIREFDQWLEKGK
jgi:uncharacterized protein (DUF305 family)